MTDDIQNPSVLSMRQEDLDELLTRAAERGAERCLAHLGLENGHADETKSLSRSWYQQHFVLRPSLTNDCQ